MYTLVLFLHVLAATIWTGGHIVLANVILPKVLKERDIEGILRFESGFEKIGIPAMLIQVLTGIWLAFNLLPAFSDWFNLDSPVSRAILFKLSLLIITIILAIDARLRIIPNLSEKNLTSLAWHIIPVTLLSILFVLAGISIRTGFL